GARGLRGEFSERDAGRGGDAGGGGDRVLEEVQRVDGRAPGGSRRVREERGAGERASGDARWGAGAGREQDGGAEGVHDGAEEGEQGEATELSAGAGAGAG